MTLSFAAYEARLAATPAASPSERGRVRAADGVELAYALFEPSTGGDDVLLFYHGGGVNMDAGYDRLAAALVRDAPLSVCLADIRGHGSSSGPRGHARRRDAPLRDVDAMASFLARRRPMRRLYLGGHSSGAGLLLNALSRGWPRAPVAGVVMLAPNLGYHAALDRAGAAFAGAAFWPFVVNWLTRGRFAGGLAAVSLDFSGSGAAASLGVVPRYTVNMALAVTPDDPGGQLAAVVPPLWIGLAGDDEIIDVERSADFIGTRAPRAAIERIAGATHLGILLDAAPPLLQALRGFGLPDAVPQ